jgi:hypothetical protein
MSQCVIAEFETRETAKLALEALEVNGFTIKDVSVVINADDPAAKHLKGLPDEATGETDVETEATATTPDGSHIGLGVLLGGAVTAPLMMAAALGPLIVIGPLIGMGVGGVLGGLLSSATGVGDEDFTKSYQDRVKAGSYLVIVHDDDFVRLNEANSILQTIGPASIDQFDD